jgi:hypothetical protein
MTAAGAGRRLVIAVCPREAGTVRLPVIRSGQARRLDARAIARELQALVSARGLGARVRVEERCAGGCQGPGPNVTVTIHAVPRPGERHDHVAIAQKTYVYSLPTLDSLAAILDENLTSEGGVAPPDGRIGPVGPLSSCLPPQDRLRRRSRR